ncbi:hypothetical protein [Burkholderia orbicola]|uniref:hypothetical protein n=1 Tax=Burkholderia orbicola TaxID=2978683 RepID=UPI00264B134E|nr:hypothetical protein [Burkholderia orbicola]MDN7560760.1 hypothetical protein [Burkholderia orbicola]
MSHLRKLYATPATPTLLFVSAGLPAHAMNIHLVTTRNLRWQTAEARASEAARVCSSRGYSVTARVVDPSGRQQAAYTAYAYGLAFNTDSASELLAAKVASPLDDDVLTTEPEIIFIPDGVTPHTTDRTRIGGIRVSGTPSGDKDEARIQAVVDKCKQDFQ